MSNNKYWILVSGRRPLSPTYLEDENDSEYFTILKLSYHFLHVERGIPARFIFVLIPSTFTSRLIFLFFCFFRYLI